MALKYKVGDRVKIGSFDWYNENKDVDGFVHCGDRVFDDYMSVFCGTTVTIGRVYPYNGYAIREDMQCRTWTDEMIEGFAEEEAKSEPKFKVGDRVKWYNHTCNITAIDTNENIYTYLIKHNDYREDKLFAKWVPENELTFEDNEETPIKIEGKIIKSNEMIVSIDEYILPDGYIFKDENGNVINATKIVLEKKKKEYPKTYEECEKVLRYDSHRLDNMGVTVRGYKWELIRAFQILLICRDAYWKIAGEEIGLGKPWEPSKDKMVYSFYRHSNEIETDTFSGESVTFEFPTAEMRDAFYENFKELINECKELL